jgi:diguanylate cyclase (GGDEF)-like protein
VAKVDGRTADGSAGGIGRPLPAGALGAAERRLIDVLSDAVERLTATRSGAFDAVIGDVLASVARSVDADRVALFRFDHEHERFDTTHAWTRDGVEPFACPSRGIRFEERPWWLGPLLAGRHHLFEREHDVPDERARAAWRAHDLRTNLAVPTRAGGGVIGALAIHHVRAAAAWAPSTVALVQVIADVIGGARDRDDLAQRSLAEARWREGLTDMVAWGLQQRLAHPLYAGLLERVANLAPEADAGSIVLRGADGRLRFVATHRYEFEPLGHVVFDTDELSHPHDMRTTTQLLHPFGRNEALGAERRDALNAFGGADRITATLVLPLLTGDLPLGFLYLDRLERDRPFSRDTVAMAQVAAAQASLVIQRLTLEATVRHRKEELERIASVDTLTGLPNRAAFFDALRMALGRAARRRTAAALLYLDLDGFKEVNDSLGHAVGDQVLRDVAGRLRDAVRSSDAVARLGGDEFTVVISDVEDASEAGHVAGKLVDAISRPFVLGPAVVRLTASIGIALYPNDADEAGDLLRRADAAMYRAKVGGRAAYRFFTAEIDVSARDRLQLTADLHGALERGALEVAYRPRVSLASGTWVGIEALARWRHPERGVIDSDVFVPLAEDTGLIEALGRFVTREACGACASWSGHPVLGALRTSLTVSMRELLYGDLVGRIEGALAAHGLRPDRLEIAVTEAAMVRDVEANLGRLDALRALGVAIALVGFGTASSSLGRLRRVPLDVVKVDRSFVAGIDRGGADAAADAAVVRAIVAIGASCGFTVVAEEVERPSQVAVLRGVGCAEGQGHVFGPPVSAEALRAAADASPWSADGRADGPGGDDGADRSA